jgi:aminoglycoside 6'-N-acetyltransferase I
MRITPLISVADPDWLRLRLALWPDSSAAEHAEEMALSIAAPQRYAQFIARSATGGALGFAEASIRSDYVNGTETSPVAFLEGLYVEPEARRQGVARRLVGAVAGWGVQQGCTELASDTLWDNLVSQQVHARLGFAETERIVYFNLKLRASV